MPVDPFPAPPPGSLLDRLAAVSAGLDETVPTKQLDRNLLVATWNLRAFGGLTKKWEAAPADSPKRDFSDVVSIAEVVSRLMSWPCKRLAAICGPSLSAQALGPRVGIRAHRRHQRRRRQQRAHGSPPRHTPRVDRRGDPLYGAFTSTGLTPAPGLSDVPRTIFQSRAQPIWSASPGRSPTTTRSGSSSQSQHERVSDNTGLTRSGPEEERSQRSQYESRGTRLCVLINESPESCWAIGRRATTSVDIAAPGPGDTPLRQEHRPDVEVQVRPRGQAVHVLSHRALLLDPVADQGRNRSEEHTSELRSHSELVCRLLLGR